MANKTAWFGGALLQQIGQSIVEVKPLSAGPYYDNTGWKTLGKTEYNNFSEIFEWTDLTNLQYGSRMANSQITGQGVAGEIGLVEMYAEVFELVWPGAKVFKTGDVVDRIVAKKAIGTRLTDYLMWFRFTQFRDGKASTDPLDAVYALMAPRMETGEINADLSPQVIALPLIGFEASEDYAGQYAVLDTDDEPLLFWTIADEYV